MVRKLLKYEFKYYFRIMVFYLPIVLAVGILGRFVQFLHFSDPGPYGLYEMLYALLFSSSQFMLTITCAAAALFTTILGVLRFYRNLYSRGGYLTFTLPVSNGKLLFTKLFAFLVCTLITAEVISISYGIFIFTSAEAFSVYREIVDFIVYLFVNIPFKDILSFILNNLKLFVNIYLFIIEYAILSFVGSILSILIYYICMSVGQLVNKGRIVLSVGIYYAYSQISAGLIYVGIYGSYIILIFSALTLPVDVVDQIVNFIGNNFYLITHTIFLSSISVVSGLVVLLYFLNLRIMNRKLNLD